MNHLSSQHLSAVGHVFQSKHTSNYYLITSYGDGCFTLCHLGSHAEFEELYFVLYDHYTLIS